MRHPCLKVLLHPLFMERFHRDPGIASTAMGGLGGTAVVLAFFAVVKGSQSKAAP